MFHHNRIKFFIALMFTGVALCFSQSRMEIKDAKKNFGMVKKGELVKLNYEITNTGNQPLIIENAEVSCSCTSVEFDKKPLLPKQTATITVIFDTKSVYDRQDRNVMLHSNDPKGPHKLRYKGVVLK